jgi:hypothetical protein
MLSREVCNRCELRNRYTGRILNQQKGWLCPHPDAKTYIEAERDGFAITPDHIPTAWCEHKLEHAVNEVIGWREVNVRELYRNMKAGDAI